MYFRSAWERSWPLALVTPHQGYMSLFNNVAAVAAVHLVPLDEAPLVTTLAALLLQLAPIAIVLFGRIRLFAGLPRQVLAVLIILVTPPSAEVWLNTINSQFYLALATGLLLLEDGEIASRVGRVLRRSFLVLAGLTGPVSCLLAPVALHRAWSVRSREAMVQAMILCTAAGVQLAILGLLGDQSTVPDRAASLNVWTTASIMVTRTVIEPVLGSDLGAEISKGIVAYSRGSRDRAGVVGVTAAVGLAALIACVLWKRREPEVLVLAAGYLLVAVLSIVGSLTRDKAALIQVSHYGGRYFYVPAVLMVLLVLSGMRRESSTFGRWRSVLCGAIVLVSLAVNARHFQDGLIIDASWPQWAAEVARWRQDPSRDLHVWPPGWSVTLERR